MPQVTLVPSSRSFHVEPGEAVLAGALRAGLNLPHSCKGGHCASCRARVLSGEWAYPGPRPVGITVAESRDGYVLLCQARALGDLRIESQEQRPAPEVDVKHLPCRVERLERLAEDVVAVALRLPAAEEFAFRAGQYLDVMLPGGRRRSFSIASAPGDGRLLVLHVRHAPGGEFTSRLFGAMQPGELLRIEGPLGQFWLRDAPSRPLLMLGGGTGYAPLRSMLRSLRAAGDPRPVTLYWGARRPHDLYEHEWLTSLESQWPGFVYRPVLSAPAPEEAWHGRTGFVHEVALAEVGDLADHDVYAAGPPAMIEAVRRSCAERGLPAAQLHFDSFDYAPDTLVRRAPTAGGS